jgi:hypothetical protein
MPPAAAAAFDAAAFAAAKHRPAAPAAHKRGPQRESGHRHQSLDITQCHLLLLLLPTADPLRLLRTKEVRNVKAAIGMLVNSAKVLSTLTAARALYECNNGDDAQLSNELFHQWAQALVDSTTMHSAGTFFSRLDLMMPLMTTRSLFEVSPHFESLVGS